MTKQPEYATTVAECVAEGSGRYNFRDSLYLVIKGNSALWEHQFRQAGKLRTKCYGSAVGAAPVGLRQARALVQADCVERRNGRQIAGNAKYHNGHANGNGGGIVTKLFSVARDQYLEEHAAEWSDDHRKSLRAMMLKHAAPLDTKMVGEISQDDIIPLLKPIWKGPNSTTGNRVRGFVEHIISSTGRIDDNPARWSVLQYRMPKTVIAYSAKSRDMMPIADIPEFMAQLALDKSVQSRALQLIVLTGVRHDDALGAPASEFDLAAKTWTISKARLKRVKGRAMRDHIVPLSDAAIKCIGTLHGGLVFPSKLGTRLSQQTVRELMPDGATVHGFRAALVSWAQAKGYDDNVQDFAIAHYPTDANDKAYKRADLLDLRREMMDDWAEFLTTGTSA